LHSINLRNTGSKSRYLPAGEVLAGNPLSVEVGHFCVGRKKFKKIRQPVWWAVGFHQTFRDGLSGLSGG